VGIIAPPLGNCYLEAPQQRGLLLGYASAAPGELREGVRVLAEVLGRQ
jgi:DNA-binding transcriptional MocR family regulator